MVRKKYQHYILGLLFLLLSACSQYEPKVLSTIVTTPGKTDDLKSTSASNITNSVTPTSNSTKTSPTQVETPKTSSIPNLITSCAKLEPVTSPNIISTGSILFYSHERSEDNVLELSKNAQESEIFLPDSPYFKVSPYSGTVAWADSKENYKFIHFLNSDGKEIKLKLAENVSPMIRQWILDDQAIFDFIGPSNSWPRKAIDEFYLMSPLTETGETHQYEFSGFFSGHATNQSQGGEGVLRYSPDLSKAVYGWGDPKSGNEGLLLWDTKNGKVIWKQGDWGWPAEETYPDWRNDGSSVAITAPINPGHLPPEIFSISGNGEENRLTYLSTVIDDPYMIFDLLWSPDDRYIAFIFNKDIQDPYMSRELYILDTETKTVTNYCLPSPVRNMVWSPDSKQIAFLVNDQELYILDILNNKAQFLDKVRFLYGWIPGTKP
jgi:hypothetical protein